MIIVPGASSSSELDGCGTFQILQTPAPRLDLQQKRRMLLASLSGQIRQTKLPKRKPMLPMLKPS